MDKFERGNITLAIETAIMGGSISLVQNGKEIDSWIGGSDVSRSEDLLISISELLIKNSFEISQLGSIGVSIGPGSYTGIRVGIATALGLKNSLHVPCAGIPVLSAINNFFPVTSGIAAAAIPIGRGDICLQVFGEGQTGEFIIDREEKMPGILSTRAISRTFLHDRLFSLGLELDTGIEIINAGDVMSKYIGVVAEKAQGSVEIMPIYVRDFV
ncbi:MAG TPA: tRNA (adenosine(37)-N6)-threonylcarbamoyltransferase complex dimerization subunit type 1 TsaB [Pyrinomonadaceae bacterium]|nr:tRNA (adenosine(37)-N6)-threonylcarbamoyltransferase complex dimerization subunit type 1 TsaB [Pyrinomonadaceae bacterium]